MPNVKHNCRRFCALSKEECLLVDGNSSSSSSCSIRWLFYFFFATRGPLLMFKAKGRRKKVVVFDNWQLRMSGDYANIEGKTP